MPFQILIIVFITAAATFGYFMAPRDDNSVVGRIVTAWISVAAIAFFVPDKLLALIIIGIVLLAIGQLSAQKRVYLYLATIIALPTSMSAFVPFPGINYLVELDYLKICTLAVLGPAFMKALSAKKSPALRNVDVLILTYILYISVLAIREVSFTSVLRQIFDQMIIVYIPYIVISRTLTTSEHMTTAIKMLFVGLLITLAIGLISTLRSWNFYAMLNDGPLGYKAFADYRNGFLRVAATTIPALTGYFMGVGIAISLTLNRLNQTPKSRTLLLTVLFAFICFATGARGGWISGSAVVILYFLFVRMSRSLRSLTTLGILGFIVGGLLMLQQGNLDVTDQYGTFDYRAELIKTAFVQIGEYPLFGEANFIQNPRFRHLIQGEGIVDIVNAYIGFALTYGLIGLILFLSANFITVSRGLKTLALMEKKPDQENFSERRTIFCLLIAMQVSYLILIATISTVSHIGILSFIILALLVANVRVETANALQQTKSVMEANGAAPTAALP